jgi:hypothetical protein
MAVVLALTTSLLNFINIQAMLRLGTQCAGRPIPVDHQHLILQTLDTRALLVAHFVKWYQFPYLLACYSTLAGYTLAPHNTQLTMLLWFATFGFPVIFSFAPRVIHLREKRSAPDFKRTIIEKACCRAYEKRKYQFALICYGRRRGIQWLCVLCFLLGGQLGMMDWVRLWWEKAEGIGQGMNDGRIGRTVGVNLWYPCNA